jgi:small neutral amino acid transporter SnatA (MarC family)
MGDELRDEADQRRVDVYSSARIGAAAALSLVLVVLIVLDIVLDIAVPDYHVSPGILLSLLGAKILHRLRWTVDLLSRIRGRQR